MPSGVQSDDQQTSREDELDGLATIGELLNELGKFHGLPEVANLVIGRAKYSERCLVQQGMQFVESVDLGVRRVG